ncbi:MAG: cytochrome C oxidase subunit IV family protein [Phycisphaerales bacterium]|nr:cytochrome C oxidase subunit IV family protein [Phycisphaerales bacterium]
MSEHHEHGAVGHIVPIKMLVGVCAILLFLTFVTVWVAKFDFETVNIGEANILIAMGVATVKATLVCLIFMHLKWDRPFVSFIFLASVLFVLLFITFSLMDTHANQPALVPGNSPVIQQKLDALEASEQAHAAAGHAPAHDDAGH